MSSIGSFDKEREVQIYQARFRPDQIKKIGRIESVFTVAFRLNQWLKILSEEKAFNYFFNITPSNEELGGLKKMDTSNLKRYSIYPDKVYFKKFCKLARKNKMSGNYALNVVLDRYCEEGNLFKVEVFV